MEVCAFVFMFALSNAMVLQPLIGKESMISANTTGNVDCNALGPNLFTFAYAPDPDSPNALQKRGQIFKSESDMVVGTFNQHAGKESSESSDLTSSSQELAGSLDVDGSYMAFSASASLKFSTSSSSQHESMRRTVKLQAFQCDVHASGFFHTAPERYLSDSFKWAIENKDAASIAQDFGAFYARAIEFGGQYSQTYIMEKTSSDNSQTFSAEITASYGTGPAQINGAVSTSVQARQASESGRIERKVSWLGGDTSVLLAAPTEDDSLNAEWAATFTNDNLYPFSYDLRPIWDLIKPVNAQKAADVETAFASTWSAEFNELNRQINNLPPLAFDPVIIEHFQRNVAKGKAQQRKEACVREGDKAQGWIDTWWAGTDRQRNRNWRTAADSCKSEMDSIKDKLDDSSVTVAKFKIWINDVAVDRSSAGRKHWGFGGNDSKESNRVNIDTAETDRAIEALFA